MLYIWLLHFKKKRSCYFQNDDEFNRNWRNKLIQIITRDRENDSNLKGQIQRRTLHICKLHYPEECLIRNPNKTTRIPGSLPTLNLPLKSHAPSSKKERPSASIDKREQYALSSSSSIKPSPDQYSSINDFNQRIG